LRRAAPLSIPILLLIALAIALLSLRMPAQQSNFPVTVLDGSTAPWITAVKCSGGAASFPASTTKALVYGLVMMEPRSTTGIRYNINTTADNTSNTYDIAIYPGTASSTVTRLLHIGPLAGTTFSPSIGWKRQAWAEGRYVLNPGRYNILITSSASSSQAQFTIDSTTIQFYNSTTAGVTIATGGTAPATLSNAADGYTTTNAPCLLID